MQVPAPVRWILPPTTEQFPLAAYETASPEEAVAPGSTSGSR